MKTIFKTMMMAVCCLGMTMFAACNNDDNDASNLKFNTSKVYVSPGATIKVTIGNGTQPFTVKSTDEKTATAQVDKNIVTVTGVKDGKASILVTDKNKLSGTIAVTVLTPISFDKANVDVSVGKEAIVNIQSGKAPYTLKVKDAHIATATIKETKITVKGLKAGKTTITVFDKDKQAGAFSVTVK